MADQQQQKVFCEACQGELNVIPPPLQPQIVNGIIMSTVAMVNGRAECTKCGQKYITQILGVQMNLGFTKLPEENRIVPATPDQIPPPPLNLVK